MRNLYRMVSISYFTGTAFADLSFLGSISSSFRTDTEISSRDPSMPRKRELQRWEPGATSGIDMSLDTSGETSWDQFAINERMYGVQSTYDEEIYTTSIDRSDPLYKQREAEAARIAREIEGSVPASAHVAEERQRDPGLGGGLDEEAKYSGVQREPSALPKRGAGAYVPPSQRPITNAPTVHGAPFDPAIISSQLARSSPPPTAENVTELTPAVDAGVTSANETQAPASEAALKPPPQPAQTNEVTVGAPTVEEHVRNANLAFKQFANDQKLRSRQAKEARSTTARAEKNVKLNDLKKFAENFKLKSRVPDDLVPILAKDPHKQHEIQHKAEEAAQLEEVRVKELEKEKASVTASPTPSASSQITPTPPGDQRMAYNQQQNSRSRISHNLRTLPQQSPSRTLPQGATAGNRGYPRTLPTVQPLPPGMQIPTGPAIPPDGPLSPSRLNAGAKAFEFRPAASSFTPSGTSPSPQRTTGSSMDRSNASETATFFDKEKKLIDPKDRKDLENAFHPMKRLLEAEYTDEQKKAYAANGGVPQPYRTPPTWPYSEGNVNVSYKDSFVKAQAPSSGPSPMHTPNSNAQMPHAHQLPPHLQGGPHMSTPSQRPQYMPPPQQPGVPPHGFDPRMQQFGPNGSVQSSPRFPQAQVAFNGQMQGMPMQPFVGQQMPGYGMSPSMQYRQVQIPQGGPMMVMPNQQHNQSEYRGLQEKYMLHPANIDVVGQMPQGYPPRGPAPQGYQQGMGGVPMVNQPSGGFMNGPMPQQQSYSPMPPPAQPYMAQMQNQGYAASPRPPMMQHSGSHQGFQSGMMPPQFAQQGQPHPYHMQQRQMSAGGYPHMTPRQQYSVPNHPSPGMGVPSQGDDGK